MVSSNAEIPLDEGNLPPYVSAHPKALWPFLVSRAAYSWCVVLAAIYMFAAFRSGTGFANEASEYRIYIQAYSFILFLQLPGGFFADHFKDKKNLLIWSGAGLAVSFFFIGLPSLLLRYPALFIFAVSFSLFATVHFTEFGSFYRNKGKRLQNGVAAYYAADATGAVIGALCFKYFLIMFQWHQIFLVLALVMLVGHIYLLQISKVYQEVKGQVLDHSSISERRKSLVYFLTISCMIGMVIVLITATSFLKSDLANLENTASNESLLQFMMYVVSAISCFFLAVLRHLRMRFALRLVGIGLLIVVAMLLFINGAFVSLVDSNILNLFISTVLIALGYGVGASLFLIGFSSWILNVSRKNTCLAIGGASAVLGVSYYAFDAWFQEDPSFGIVLAVITSLIMVVVAIYFLKKPVSLHPIEAETVDEPAG